MNGFGYTEDTIGSLVMSFSLAYWCTSAISYLWTLEFLYSNPAVCFDVMLLVHPLRSRETPTLFDLGLLLIPGVADLNAYAEDATSTELRSCLSLESVCYSLEIRFPLGARY